MTRISDYLQYFSLTADPFASAPDEKFFFNSPQHSRAFQKVLHALNTKKGLSLVLGELGLGKTMLARKLLDHLISTDVYDPGLLVIIHSSVSPIWFLQKVAALLDIEVSEDNFSASDIITRISRRLVELNDQDKIPVLLIDESNMLKTKDIMEEIRGLLNIETSGQRLLNFVLFGLPETEENLKLDPALFQRVSIKVWLETMDEKATIDYIQHRLSIAGAKDEIFAHETYSLIYKLSLGKPRLVNTICDNALLEVFLQKRKKIDTKILVKIAKELGFTNKEE